VPFAEGVSGLAQMSTDSHFDSDAELQRYEALLEMADLVVHHHSLPDLFLAMAGRLRTSSRQTQPTSRSTIPQKM
jgi:hypothetical protein